MLVFGRRSGLDAARYVKEAAWGDISRQADELALSQISGLKNAQGKESVADIRKKMQVTMDQKVSVFRHADDMKAAIGTINDLREAYQDISIMDKGSRFNTDLLEALELG